MADSDEIVPGDGRLDFEFQTAKPGDIEFERIKSEDEDYTEGHVILDAVKMTLDK